MLKYPLRSQSYIISDRDKAFVDTYCDVKAGRDVGRGFVAAFDEERSGYTPCRDPSFVVEHPVIAATERATLHRDMSIVFITLELTVLASRAEGAG
jgi:hypothetical protein